MVCGVGQLEEDGGHLVNGWVAVSGIGCRNGKASRTERHWADSLASRTTWVGPQPILGPGHSDPGMVTSVRNEQQRRSRSNKTHPPTPGSGGVSSVNEHLCVAHGRGCWPEFLDLPEMD